MFTRTARGNVPESGALSRRQERPLEEGATFSGRSSGSRVVAAESSSTWGQAGVGACTGATDGAPAFVQDKQNVPSARTLPAAPRKAVRILSIPRGGVWAKCCANRGGPLAEPRCSLTEPSRRVVGYTARAPAGQVADLWTAGFFPPETGSSSPWTACVNLFERSRRADKMLPWTNTAARV